MTLNLSNTDLWVLFPLLILQISVGIYVSLSGRDSKDYFLAGNSLPWWMVAGSVFSTNVSALHLIGMLGIGFSVGFAQSHYEILAIFAIFFLVFVFIPIYRKLKIFTLSQFLEARYGEKVRTLYSVLMMAMILVQLIGGFYISSRALVLITSGTQINIDYTSALVLIALVTLSYTFFGGLKAVVVTDTIQTVFIVISAFILFYFTFSQPEIGGFANFLSLDSSPEGLQKMKLYLPASHPDLPWTGVFTGLVILHGFYWITNQFMVQRVIAAKSEQDAAVGALAAGGLKFIIPFFSISTGVAAAYIFNNRLSNKGVMPDDAFIVLMEQVVPNYWGIKGLIVAGIAASIFSSLDSMLNSLSTLFSIDIYKKYIRTDVNDHQLVKVGRLTVALSVLICITLAYITFDPQFSGNFFLKVSSWGAYFTPGIIVAFFMAVFYSKSNTKGAFTTMLLAPFLGLTFEFLYVKGISYFNVENPILGEQLNFLHRILLTVISGIVIVFLMRSSPSDSKFQNVMFPDREQLKRLRFPIISFVVINILMLLLVWASFNQLVVSTLAAILSSLIFILQINKGVSIIIMSKPRVISAFLLGLTMFILYFFR